MDVLVSATTIDPNSFVKVVLYFEVRYFNVCVHYYFAKRVQQLPLIYIYVL